MNIRTASSEADISYSINGGTINTFVITTISSYKHSNFNILPNVNNLVNGTLTFNVLTFNVLSPTQWSGNVVFTRTSGAGSNVFVSVKTDAGFIANQASFPANNTFAVSLPTSESYLYIYMESAGGGWVIGTEGFTQAVGEYTNVYADNRNWRRYVIGNYQGTLNYNFTTFFDD
jgi:hypothetical protein